jgi:CBS domain-containing protein
MSRQPSGVRALAVSTLMTVNRATISLNATIIEAMQIMTDRRVRHLPVIDGGRVVGVVSIGDVVKARLDQQASEVESMKAYVTGVH